MYAFLHNYIHLALMESKFLTYKTEISLFSESIPTLMTASSAHAAKKNVNYYEINMSPDFGSQFLVTYQKHSLRGYAF